MSAERRLLAVVVDDDLSMAQMIAEVLGAHGFEARAVDTGAKALEAINAQVPDLVVSDVRMQPMGGIELLRAARSAHPELIFILMTAFGTLESAIEAVREGAYDYVSKPFKIEELLLVVDRALESRRIAAENRDLRGALREQQSMAEIVGRSPAMFEVFKAIARAADSTASVLIQGETGTGKELVARSIHQHGSRRARPFLAINCAALPENLLENELFGHEKGAFTGAIARKAGLFEQADGGSVLLDEIGEMPLALQSKLLRTLQSGEVRSVGAGAVQRVDVRVLAASNRDLRHAVSEGTFREDLFFRLNTITIRVPALREHMEDLPLLAERFLRAAAERSGKPVQAISREALALLTRHDWPGNVRELEHAIDRAVSFARQDMLLPEDIPQELSEPRASRLMSLDDLEKQHILYVLKTVQGNRQRGAEVLGIDRKTLYRKLLRYGMDRPDDKEE
ncbi:MAG: sigma-54-dependent Fis family transcriptional regulator [Planctomycetes bacterium]|nr:sigma-54-dependent Fis family transcriptional regulator [Planctomycetota bacterium]